MCNNPIRRCCVDGCILKDMSHADLQRLHIETALKDGTRIYHCTHHTKEEIAAALKRVPDFRKAGEEE